MWVGRRQAELSKWPDVASATHALVSGRVGSVSKTILTVQPLPTAYKDAYTQCPLICLLSGERDSWHTLGLWSPQGHRFQAATLRAEPEEAATF